ncbi:hypothetical protein GCM10007880_61520 [Mesorhizobium amorphae]|nr:hypothetical protein GCM10007880_61520 [Mesorhizobium amorphae]
MTFAAVGNAPWQFSGIKLNLKHAYGALNKMPAAHIKRKVVPRGRLLARRPPPDPRRR